MSSVQQPRIAQPLIGTACLFAGVALAVTVVAVRLEGLWSLPSGLIRRNPVLMLGFSFCLILGGSRLLWQTRTFSTHWQPSILGRRFRSVVLFTKADCPLCEEARGVLSAYQPYLPPVETIDITSDPEWESRYSGCVPVVEIDGRRRFTGQISEILLRQLIEGSPPNGS